MAAKKVCIIGSGNWGSAIAKIVGANAAKYNTFDSTVNMWVFEEMINGRKLTEIINTEHENVKYLPGRKLPPNVVAVPELLDAVKGADILIFVIPHQFVSRVCDTIKGHIKTDAVGMSLIKCRTAAEELAQKSNLTDAILEEEAQEFAIIVQEFPNYIDIDKDVVIDRSICFQADR